MSKMLAVVRGAINKFAKEHPRLYAANKDFFDYIVENWDLLWQKALEYWNGSKKRRSFHFIAENKLSNWTEIVVRIRRDWSADVFKAYRYHRYLMPGSYEWVTVP